MSSTMPAQWLRWLLLLSLAADSFSFSGCQLPALPRARLIQGQGGGRGANPRVLPAGGGVRGLRAEWLSTSGEVTINAPPEFIWGIWENLEDLPLWQPWLHDVKCLPDDLSVWTLKKKVAGIPLSFSWTAKSLPPEKHQLIHWEAVSGTLANRGRVNFAQACEAGETTHIKMTIEYKLPKIVATIFRANEGGFVNRKITHIIQRDLETFRAIAEDLHHKGGDLPTVAAHHTSTLSRIDVDVEEAGEETGKEAEKEAGEAA